VIEGVGEEGGGEIRRIIFHSRWNRMGGSRIRGKTCRGVLEPKNGGEPGGKVQMNRAGRSQRTAACTTKFAKGRQPTPRREEIKEKEKGVKGTSPVEGRQGGRKGGTTLTLEAIIQMGFDLC